jgi:ABC-type amino acid transport substrate-binding protein
VVGAVCAAAIAVAAVGTAGAQPVKKPAPHGVNAKLAALLPASIKKSHKVSFGALWETPPIIGVDPKDTSKPVGAAVDLAAAVSKILGVKPVWKNLQWPAQLPGLQSGNIDVLWGQVSDSAQREQSVADLIAWMQTPIAMLVPAGNPKHLTTFANACGLKIAVPTGSQQQAVVDGNSAKYCSGKSAIQAVGYPGAQGAIVALKAGTVDGWMDAKNAIAAIVKSDPADFSMITPPAAEIDPYMSTIGGVAVGKQLPGLTKAIAGALKELALKGTYQKIMKKWGSASAVMAPSQIKINTYTGIKPGVKG